MKTLFAICTATLICLNVASSVNAAPVTVTVTGEVLSGSFFGEMATGTILFDDESLTGTGDETISPLVGGLTLDFMIFGQSFDETNDVDFDEFPSLEFADGVIVGFDWVVHEIFGDVLTPITMGGVFGFDMFTVIQSIGGGGEISISGEVIVDEIGTVPLPAALPLFAAAFGILGLFKRRRAQRTPIDFS